jgi:hypothetical protein
MITPELIDKTLGIALSTKARERRNQGSCMRLAVKRQTQRLRVGIYNRSAVR